MGKLNTEFRIVVINGENGIEMKSAWSVHRFQLTSNVYSLFKKSKASMAKC